MEQQVIFRKDMKHPFNSMLIALVAIDIGFLIFNFGGSALWSLQVTAHTNTMMYAKFMFPMSGILMTASIFIIVAISVERYVALCHQRVCKF